MKFDFEIKIKDSNYLIIIECGFFKTNVEIYELRTLSSGIKADYKIKRASTILDWLKWVIKKPIRIIYSKIYYLYHHYILND